MYTELQDDALMWNDNNEAAIFQTNHNTVQKEFVQQLYFVGKLNPVKKTCHHSSSDSLPQ